VGLFDNMAIFSGYIFPPTALTAEIKYGGSPRIKGYLGDEWIVKGNGMA
jgi:hypothetical protein